MENQRLPPSKRILFTSILFLFPVLLVLLAGEIILRINPKSIRDPVPGPPYDTRLLDDTFGWRVKPHYKHDGVMKDLNGNEYPIHITFSKDGFRSFPTHTNPDRLKIFLVGDSYTESLEVSDDKTWYSILPQHLPVDLYAYGSAGYGTMQQFMILQHYFDQIQPDIVILQLCTNDFSDNYCLLEKETNYKVGQRRPYMSKEGKTFYDRAWLPRKHLREYSYFLYYLSLKYDNLKSKITGEPRQFYGEGKIVEQQQGYEPFKNSVETTDLIIKKMKEFLDGKAEFLAFTADNFDPATSTLKEICEQNNVAYIDGVGAAVQGHQEAGEIVRSSDGYHWNEPGHEVVAGVIKEKLLPVISKLQGQEDESKKDKRD